MEGPMFDLLKNNKKPIALPPALEPENPVNYQSVLDYLVGLSDREYDKLQKVSGIYRRADKDAAKILGVKNEPITQLKEQKPSEDEEDAAMDSVLAGDYQAGDEPDPEAPRKAQAPEKKINVNEA